MKINRGNTYNMRVCVQYAREFRNVLFDNQTDYFIRENTEKYKLLAYTLSYQLDDSSSCANDQIIRSSRIGVDRTSISSDARVMADARTKIIRFRDRVYISTDGLCVQSLKITFKIGMQRKALRDVVLTVTNEDVCRQTQLKIIPLVTFRHRSSV